VYKTYYHGTFAQATNSLADYVRFVHAKSNYLFHARQVDLILYNADIHLAYMLMCRGDVNSACARLNAAYEFHHSLESREGWDSVPKAEFPGLIVRGIEKVDATNRPAWKSEFDLETNTIKAVISRFR
jgi:hypothetical protein